MCATASGISQFVWESLDNPTFDKAVAGAKTAAAAYATKKAVELVSNWMGRGKGKAKSPTLPKAIVKAMKVPGPNNRSRPLARKAAQTRVFRAAGISRSSARNFGRTSSLPVTTGRSFRQGGGSVNGRQSTVVSKTEFLMDVSGSASFSNTSFAVNPGVPSTFPWLAPIAAQYEEYRFKSLTFRYETSSSSTFQGEVVLVTDYDVYDTPFANKQLAMNYKGAVRTQTWAPARLTLDRQQARAYNKLFVRSGVVPGDQKTYDVGLFQLITQGQSATTAIGELYVEYVIELIGPKTNNVPGASLIGIDARSGGTVSPTNILGTSPVVQAGSQLDLSYEDGTFNFPTQSGQFLLSVTVTGTGVPALTFSSGTNASIVTEYANFAAASGLGATLTFSINLAAQNATFGVTAVGATTITSAVVVMQQMSSGLSLSLPKKKKVLKPQTPDEALRQRLSELESKLARLVIAEAPPVRPHLMVAPMTGN